MGTNGTPPASKGFPRQIRHSQGRLQHEQHVYPKVALTTSYQGNVAIANTDLRLLVISYTNDPPNHSRTPFLLQHHFFFPLA